LGKPRRLQSHEENEKRKKEFDRFHSVRLFGVRKMIVLFQLLDNRILLRAQIYISGRINYGYMIITFILLP